MKVLAEASKPIARRVAAGIGLLVGLPALVLTFVNLDLTASELIRAAIVTGLAIVPAGYLVTRGLGLSRTVLPSGMRFAFACLVGYPISAAAFYFLSVLRLQVLFPVAIAGAAVAALVLKIGGIKAMGLNGPRDAALRVFRWLGSRNWLLFALLALILLATTRGNRAFVPVEGRLAYNHEVWDQLVRQSFYWEMLRAIPPQELPTVAGLPFLPYHILSYMLGVMFAKYGGIGVITIYHAIMPLVHLSLLVGALYIAVRARTENSHAAAASLVTVFFISNTLEVHFRYRLLSARVPLEYFLRSMSGASGMVVGATIVCLLMLYAQARRQEASERPGRRLLYLAAVLVGLLYGFKAQVFLLLGSACFLALLILFLRDRRAELLWAGAISALTFALVYLSWRSDAYYSSFAFSPGLFADMVYRRLRQEPHPFFSEILLSAFRSLPDNLGWFAATAFGMWRVLHFSLLVPLYALWQARSHRSTRLADVLLCLTLPIALFMGYGLGTVAADFDVSANSVIQAVVPLSLVTPVINVVVFVALLDRLSWLRGNGGKLVLFGALLMSACLLPILLETPAHRTQDNLIVLTPDEQGALIYLREKTPLDAVVINARTESAPEFMDPEFRESIIGQRTWLNRYAVVSGLTGRRSVLENYSQKIDPEWNRETDIRTLFATADAEEAETILDRYSVDYVLEYSGLPLKFPAEEADLHVVYDSSDVRILAVGEPSGESLPEGPLYAPSGLR
jgi:hypothetical protein